MEPVSGNSTPQDQIQVQANATSPLNSSPLSQHPSDTTNMTNAGAGVVSVFPYRTLSGTQKSFSNNTLCLESLLSDTVSELSPGNPLQEPTNITSKTSEDHCHSEPLQQEGQVSVPAVKQRHESAHSGNNLDETHFSSSQQTSPAAEQGHQNMANGNLIADSAVVLGEACDSNPDKSLSSSLPLFSKSSECSSADPIHVPVSADKNVIPKCESGPGLGAEQGHQNMANSNLSADSAAVIGEVGDSNPDKSSGSPLPLFSKSSERSSADPIRVPVSADTNVIPKCESGTGFGAESSEDDIPISSPKHGDGGGHNSVAIVADENRELGTNNGLETQNPPTQVMERSEDPDSTYRIPSHVFDTDKSNTMMEWSTCSTESLFSIHIGNMSFSNELSWLKSGDFGYPGETYMSGPLDASPNNIPPANPNPPTEVNLASVNKLNDISPRTHDGSPGVTEAKAAATMREVIRENTEKIGTRDLSFRETSLPIRPSHRSDGSAASFVFPILAGDEYKCHSLKEKPNQQKQSDQETPTLTGYGKKSLSSNGVEGKPNQQNPAETPDADQLTQNPSQNRWLSCFACCTFCWGHNDTPAKTS